MANRTLAVAIIARDEARHIGAALASAAPIADELLVVLDPRTSDATAAIAEQHGATVQLQRFVSFSQQRNHALALSGCAWVLFLDADERITPELAAELQSWRAEPDERYAGYWLPRRNLYFGRPLRGGGWYPDRQLRLLRCGRARYDETRLVHELAELDGPAGELSGHLLHINIETWAELREKQQRYALAEAQTLARAGVRAKWRNLALQPLREVKRRFVTWRGYRDGALGLVLALALGYYELVKYIHLKGLERAQ
jgi:glycosyltransferase involved in cell wall biosynthesis